MGAKKTVQKQGAHEKALIEQGTRKAALGKQIGERANKYVNETSTKNYSELYRGRLNADAAQSLSGAQKTAYMTAAQTGGGKEGLSKVDKAAGKARLSALSEGTKRGTISRDKNIFSAMDVSMGKQAGSSRNMSQLAKQESREIATQAKIAADEANSKRGALMGLASAGLGAYQQNKMDALRETDMAQFDTFKELGIIDKDMSYADFSQNFKRGSGQRGASYLTKNLSWTDRMANALGGAG